jgi:hypothetical protein
MVEKSVRDPVLQRFHRPSGDAASEPSLLRGSAIVERLLYRDPTIQVCISTYICETF